MDINEIRAQYAGFFLAAVGPTIRALYIIDAIGFAFHSCLSTHVSTASDRLRTEASVVSPKHDTAVQGRAAHDGLDWRRIAPLGHRHSDRGE
jgi:hypothetical protein